MVQFPPFGDALDTGRARPCASYAAIPPVGGGEAAVRGGEAAVGSGEVAVRGGEAAVRGGVEPISRTTSAKNADNGVLWLVVCVVGPCLDSCVARTRTRYCVR